ncbi:MAG: zinc-binding alcohol dehydrogenase family protein [Planctomycetes bacterium]|nr:zinc-binding alcohol dehydrogenase family protein [Planctomycetota bacterium]
MQQVILERPGKFRIQEKPEPAAGAGEALVKIHRIGVCGTDLHAFAGRQPFFDYPRVLGHELGVEVLSLPTDGAVPEGISVGSRCAIEPYLYCGECPTCRAGRTNCCHRLRTLGVHTDGGMQATFAIPVRLLHPSASLSFDQLALVETLGIGAQAVRRSQLSGAESALVVGAGPIGLAVIQFAQASGARVRVLEPNPLRRDFVARLGVEAAADWSGFDRQPADIVFDATGNLASMENSFDLVAPGGRLVFVGLVIGRVSFDDPSFHRRELTILASRNSAGLFPWIIQRIEQGVIDTQPWITHRLALSSVPDRFPELPGQPQLVKALIEVD